MKKFFMIVISMLLVISFFFMIIPASLQLFFIPSGNNPFSFIRSPSIEESPSWFYLGFIDSAYVPLLEKEEELLFLYAQPEGKAETSLTLSQMEADIKALFIPEKYQEKSLQPLYDSYERMKLALLLLIEQSKMFEDSLDTFFNAEDLRPYYESYVEEKEILQEVTIQTFTTEKIIFFLEDDGTFTVYDP